MSPLALLLAVPALAQEPTCEALTPEELGGRVSIARQALFYEEMGTFAAVAHELEERIPCLTAVPAPEVWAQHLVSLAVLAYAQDGDWQTPLASALRVHPSVDRGVGATHPIAQWSAPYEDTGTLSPVPRGVTVHIDARKVSYVPALKGPHLVQVERGGVLRSAFLVDQPIPAEWLPVPAAELPTPSTDSRAGDSIGWLAVSAGLGWRGGSQRVETPGDFLADDSGGVPFAGIGVIGQMTVAGPVGLTIEGAAQLAEFPLVAGGSVGLGLVSDALTATVGAALIADSVRVLDSDLPLVALAPALMVGTTPGAMDGRVELAWAPAVSRIAVNSGIKLGAGTLAPRIGLHGAWSQAHLVQADSGRAINVGGWQAAATFGVRLGS